MRSGIAEEPRLGSLNTILPSLSNEELGVGIVFFLDIDSRAVRATSTAAFTSRCKIVSGSSTNA